MYTVYQGLPARVSPHLHLPPHPSTCLGRQAILCVYLSNVDSIAGQTVRLILSLELLNFKDIAKAKWTPSHTQGF